jgi:hypothetical protein
MPGKRVQFHSEVLSALEELAGDRMATFQELADEAFNDLLKKHDRPVGIRAMLKGSSVKASDRSNVVRICPRAKV